MGLLGLVFLGWFWVSWVEVCVCGEKGRGLRVWERERDGCDGYFEYVWLWLVWVCEGYWVG